MITLVEAMIMYERRHLHRQYFEDPRLIDHILDDMQDRVAIKAARANFITGVPQWDMWMERLPFGEGFSPVAEVRMTTYRQVDP